MRLMARKGIAVMAAVLLVLAIFPELALGAGISLDLNKSSAAVGENVNASGETGLNEPVCIKVVDSAGSIVVFDIIRSDDSGYYSYSFKIPQGVSGTMTVTTGCGKKVVSKTLTPAANTPQQSITAAGNAIEETIQLDDEVVRSQIISSRGGIIKIAGAMFTFPSMTFSEDIKVSIKKLRKNNIPSIPSRFEQLGDVWEITTDKEVVFMKPVTITLDFDPEKTDSYKYDLAVYYWNNKEWIMLEQSKVNLETGKVSGTTEHGGKFAILLSEKRIIADEQQPIQDFQPEEFQDTANHWAENFIKRLMVAGAISGYPDGTFRPDNTITRAEFIVITAKVLGLKPEDGGVFTDTAGHWAQGSISSGVAHGIVSGYDANNFGPDDPITREQMAVMISKAAQLSGGEGEPYADSSQIASWAREAVAAASAEKIISGYPDNTFRPQAGATRAEAVTVIVKALIEQERG